LVIAVEPKMGHASVETAVDPRAAPRQTLLEVTYARLDALGVGARGVLDLPARVVLLCENEARVENAEGSCEFWPKLFQESQQGESAISRIRDGKNGNATKPTGTHTGASLVYPDATLVTIESTGGGIIAVLRALEKMSLARREKNQASDATRFPFVQIRVCASTEDARALFPGWHHSFVKSLALDEYEFVEDAWLLRIASQANIACVTLGKALGEATDAGAITQKLSELGATTPDGPFPTLQHLMGVLRNTEGPPTLGEFLDVYDAPLDVDLDSENVWPAPPLLRF
jgi:hypothetical protein